LTAAIGSHRVVDVVAGPGHGGTRVALECAARLLADNAVTAAYFINPANALASANWYADMIPEQPALLVADQLDDDDGLRVLRRILEELTTGRAMGWRLLLVRKPYQTRLAEVLPRSPPLGAPIRVEPLRQDDSVELASEVLGRFAPESPPETRDRFAKEISRYANGVPGWVVLIARTLAESGSVRGLPSNERSRVEVLMRAIARDPLPPRVSSDAFREVLLRVALLGRLRLGDSMRAEWVRTEAGLSSTSEVASILELARQRGVAGLTTYAGDTYSITPRVLGDALLHERLTAPDTNGSSAFAVDLARRLTVAVADADQAFPVREVLATLARHDYSCADAGDVRTVAGQVIDGALRRAWTQTASPSRLLEFCDILEEIGIFFPTLTSDLCRDALARDLPPETRELRYVGTVSKTMDDVRDRLPWALFMAARGCRTSRERYEVLCTLVASARREALISDSIARLENQGKSSGRILSRVLESVFEVPPEFVDDAARLANDLLNAATPSEADKLAAEQLFRPLVRVERVATEFVGNKFRIARYAVSSDQPQGRARTQVLARLWKILAGDPLNPWRRLAWLVIDSSREAGLLVSPPTDDSRQMLESAAQVLEAQPDLSMEELVVARKVWHWYLEHETDPDKRTLAQRCEDRYRVFAQADKLGDVLSSDSIDGDEEEAVLASLRTSPDGIRKLIAAARRLDTNFAWHRARRLAERLGASASDTMIDEAARAFASHFGRDRDLLERILSGALATARARGDDVLLRLWERLDAAASGPTQLELRARLYGPASPFITLTFTLADLAVVRGRLGALAASYPDALLSALGGMYRLDPQATRSGVEEAWQAIEPRRRLESFNALIHGLYWVLGTKEMRCGPSREHSEWLLDQLVYVPDASRFGGNSEWYLNDIVKRQGKPDLQWLARFLRRRIDRSVEEGYDAIPHHLAIDQLVEASPASAEAFDEVFDLVAADQASQYMPPKWLAGVEPAPNRIEACVERRFASWFSTVDGLVGIARWLALVPKDSPAWRRLATRICVAGRSFGMAERSQIYFALVDRGIRMFSGPVGEVSPQYFTAVTEAERRVLEESADELREFREWDLSRLQAELEREKQRVAEEER
jgi:hypothetical protein